MNHPIKFTEEIIDKILNELIYELFINRNKIKVLKKYKLEEISLLYYQQSYISISIFFNKLIFLLEKNKSNLYDIKDFNKKKIKQNFYIFNDTQNIINLHYFDYDYNNKVLFSLKKIIQKNNYQLITNTIKFKRINVINPISDFLKRFIFLNKTSLNYVYESSKWMDCIFDKNNRFYTFQNLNFISINFKYREIIKQIAYKVIKKNLKKYFTFNSEYIEKNISKFFSEYYNSFISLKLLERIPNIEQTHKKFLHKNKVKTVHSCNGYYYSDEFKIFCIIAKQKGASLISHSHGVNNFMQIISNNNKIPNFYKSQCLYKHTDYFISWKSKLSECDIWEGVDNRFKVKILNIGSVYLHNLRKWKPKNNKDKILLFVGSPFRKHKISFCENSYEENYKKNIRIKNFLEKSLKLYEKLTIIYKPFSHTYKKDPINIFIKKISIDKKIYISKKSVTDLMYQADLVMFDSISTGFAEAVAIEAPTFIYNNEFEYNLASKFGKKINDLLYQSDVIFYDEEKGLEIMKKLIVNKTNHNSKKLSNLQKFQKAIAYPISKNNFLENMNNLI